MLVGPTFFNKKNALFLAFFLAREASFQCTCMQTYFKRRAFTILQHTIHTT